jgi:adenylyl- and sulfurtransferase ThiI
VPAKAAIPLPQGVQGVLVRFGEIGIKSAPVRRSMVERLRENLLDALVRTGGEGDIKALGSRLWMTGPDLEALLRAAERTFGVVSASPCLVVPGTIEAISEAAARLAVERPWGTFAVRATREGTHPFSSQDVQVQAGSAVWKAAQAAGRTPKVDLGKPDLAVHVDVRQDKAYLFIDSREGPGGIPLGSQGQVVMLLSDEGSFVAAWLLMRRGCSLVPVHVGTPESLDLAAVEALHAWGLPRDVLLFPVDGPVSKATLLQAAGRVALEVGAPAIATGDTLGSALGTPRLPVLRPLCGLLPAEAARWLRRIGLPQVRWSPNLDAAAPATVDTVMATRRTVAP